MTHIKNGYEEKCMNELIVQKDDYHDGIVSVVIPCLNGEKHVFRLFKSILSQTYKKIQIIFVNDGSTDRTEEIFYEYAKKFSDEGYSYKYIYQNNQGQASAINSGLKFVTGEYMMWIDADDYMTKDHLQKKINFLKQNSEYKMVMCEGRIVREDNLHEEKGMLSYKNVANSVFEDIAFEYSGCTGALYMVETKAFFSVFPEKKIAVNKVGQNLQMLLPLCYSYKIGLLNESLFTYVDREDSHSHSFVSIDKKINRIFDVYNFKKNILESLFNESNEKYKNYIIQVMSERELDSLLMLVKNNYSEIPIDFGKKIYKLLMEKINISKTHYYIWGYTEKNQNISRFFKEFGNISIRGYIDSDEKKQNEMNVFSPKTINPLTDFIVILLNVYSDITCLLDELHMQPCEDYYYPKFQISKDIDEGKEFYR